MKFQKEYAFLLLPISYLTFIFLKQSASLADSLSLACLVGLFAYILFLKSKENPEMENMVKNHIQEVNALNTLNKAQLEATLTAMHQDFNRDIKKLSDDHNKIFMSGQGKGMLFNEKKVRF